MYQLLTPVSIPPFYAQVATDTRDMRHAGSTRELYIYSAEDLAPMTCEFRGCYVIDRGSISYLMEDIPSCYIGMYRIYLPDRHAVMPRYLYEFSKHVHGPV